MVRSLRYILVIAILAGGAAWLADQPGSVVMEWGGYHMETGFGVLMIAIASLAVLTALVYRGWLFLKRAPDTLRGLWRNRRQDRGYRALTRGMVAVAAGDGTEARRQARKAEGLLNEPPLTMLLSAQAAQLDGDERAAERFFRAMTENPETAFLGLRGLLNQALKRDDTRQALAITRRAHGLNPRSDWVAASLFDLQIRSAQWLEAHDTVREAVRNKHISPGTGKRRQAILNYQMSLDVLNTPDNSDRAFDYARSALKLAPDFVPAVMSVARTLIGSGKHRKAMALIERVWAKSPHPHMVALYLSACFSGMEDSQDSKSLDAHNLKRVRAMEKLCKANPDHMESSMALAGAALTARLWGKARDHLDRATVAASRAAATTERKTKAGKTGKTRPKGPPDAAPFTPPARICRMMAELEEHGHENMPESRQWLVRASMADPDPAWVCQTCGHSVTNWSATCGGCQDFDRYRWMAPPHVLRPDVPAIQTLVTNDQPDSDSPDESDENKGKSAALLNPPAPAEG